MLFELNRRADDEMIGLETDNSGSFVVYFDRTAIEKDPNKTTSRPFLSYLAAPRVKLSSLDVSADHKDSAGCQAETRRSPATTTGCTNF